MREVKVVTLRWPTFPWRVLKRMLLLFWAVWLSLVFAGNVCDALKTAGFLPEAFRFVSGNYDSILQVAAPFGLPAALTGLLYAGVIGWEGLSAVLFWYTGLTFKHASDCPGPLVLTFTVSLALWAAFQLACEALPSPLAYQIAGVHRGLFTAQLATLLPLVLLPDDVQHEERGS
jgi:hypothetical protein